MVMRIRKIWLMTIMICSVILVAMLPQSVSMPVDGATHRDWHPRSFWASPWGRSGVHKGIDIFAPEGTSVRAPTPGVVLYRGNIALGGKVIVMLTTRWRIHYFAHLQDYDDGAGRFVVRGAHLGEVGSTGNAAGKPSHLHYAVISLVPQVTRWDLARQGWKKMFYLDPGALIEKNHRP